jgi:hypothetical protein
VASVRRRATSRADRWGGESPSRLSSTTPSKRPPGRRMTASLRIRWADRRAHDRNGLELGRGLRATRCSCRCPPLRRGSAPPAPRVRRRAASRRGQARGHHDTEFAAFLHRDEQVARAQHQVHDMIRDLLIEAARGPGRSPPTAGPDGRRPRLLRTCLWIDEARARAAIHPAKAGPTRSRAWSRRHPERGGSAQPRGSAATADRE